MGKESVKSDALMSSHDVHPLAMRSFLVKEEVWSRSTLPRAQPFLPIPFLLML